MPVTQLGIVMEVKLEHPSKALSPMLFTLFGMIVFLHPKIRALVAFSMMALQLFRESYWGFAEFTLMEVSPVQPEKAPFPMLVTLSGMSMEVRPEQPLNAPSPMLVTLLPISMEVRLEQLPKA